MNKSLRSIDTTPLNPVPRKDFDDTCTAQEISQILRVAGEINYFCYGLCLLACFAASELPSRLSDPKVSDIFLVEKTLCSLQSLDNPILYRKPASAMSSTTYFTYSDAGPGNIQSPINIGWAIF